MYRIVAIDDEEKILKTILTFVSENLPDVNVVGTAHSVKKGIEIIHETQPHLVLLDIEMPEASGFDLFRHFPSPFFQVAFITAYNDYAVQAFKVNAIDYILKPFDANDIVEVVRNAQKKEPQSKIDDLLLSTIGNLYESKKRKIQIVTKSGIEYLNPDDIIKLEADGNYTKIYSEHMLPILATKKLKDFECILPEPQFLRSHKSYLINLDKVARFNSVENVIIMYDQSRALLSRNKKQSFLNIMEQFYII